MININLFTANTRRIVRTVNSGSIMDHNEYKMNTQPKLYLFDVGSLDKVWTHISVIWRKEIFRSKITHEP